MTNDDITTEQITALRAEAGAAGDLEQVALCDRALDGDEAAWAACAETISDWALEAAATDR